MGSGAATPQLSPGRRRGDAIRSCGGLRVSAAHRDHSLSPQVKSNLGPRWALHNESDQANRAISTGKLHALLRFHTRPINVVVFHGSQGSTGFEVGFPLRCFQRLSRPYIATLLCRWRDNRSTRGTSIPVLSYWGQILSKLLHPRQIGTELSHDVLNPAHVPL